MACSNPSLDQLPSRDRYFPLQDEIKENQQLGSLIAYPFQGKVAKSGHTLLLDPDTDYVEPYDDQLEALKNVQRITEQQLDDYIAKFSPEVVKTEHSKDGNVALNLEDVLKCEFLRYCYENQETLPEPLWLAMITNLCRLPNGRELCHEFSKNYLGYTQVETDKKIDHALKDLKPYTCAQIRSDGYPCSKNCRVKSPISFFMKKALNAWNNEKFPSGFTEEEIMKALEDNEDGDAELFRKLNKYKLVYDHLENKWYNFNDIHWEQDVMKKRLIMFESTVELYKERLRFWTDRCKKAAEEGKTKEIKEAEDKCKLFRNRIRAIGTLTRKENILKLAAAGDDSLGIRNAEWQKNRDLLGCKNGVIHLTTGELLPGRPEDHIRIYTLSDYYAIDTPAPNFNKFFNEIFSNDPELVNYVQRLLGYALSGKNNEQILPILYGQGRNGKSTLMEILRFVLGDLACPIPSEMLLKEKIPRSGAAPSPDKCLLKDKRIVWASEIDSDWPLALEKIKSLVGNDSIWCRRPHDPEGFDFSPTHTLFLLTNHKPKTGGGDFAFWDRIHLIPFELSFVDNPQAPNELKRDVYLLEKLKAEAAGILAFLIRGYRKYREDGLQVPQKVIAATETYKAEQDNFEQFLKERCIVDKNLKIKASDFYFAYQNWCERMDETPLGSRQFGERAVKPFERKRDGAGKHYLGVGLRGDKPDAIESAISNVKTVEEYAEQGLTPQLSVQK